jgi:putative hemolysin
MLGQRARQAFRPLLDVLTRQNDLQRLYDTVAHLQGSAFIEGVLRELDIRLELDPAELRRLPATGAFVAVANHPSGIMDGVVLLHLLLQARPDLAAVATDRLRPLLAVLPDQLLLVDPDATNPTRNAAGVRELLQRLHNDQPLLLFPAGEVAHPTYPFGLATEPAWHPTAARLLLRARVPVVPIWLSGHNSAAFQLLSLLHPLLRTARLPAELLNKRGQTIRVRIGQPLRPTDLLALPPDRVLPHLRARVFALGAADIPPRTPTAEAPLPSVVPETDAQLIEGDLARLRPGRLLVHSRNWEVYAAKAAEIPHVLREIGRLRELTFRAVGEGTGHAHDLDEYDQYYRHLFLYDRDARRLVGAYRLGPGRSILRKMGKRGLYLNSLFRLKKPLKPLLRESLELGRSWVRAEYQRQPLPLALLWKGLATWLARHPDYHFLIGPVSISNRFSQISKALLTQYLTQYYFDPELAQHVKPRKPFRYRPWSGAGQEADPTALLPTKSDSLDALDRLLAEIEPGGLGVPVLLRQYLRQHGRLIGFNLDPAFSNALDGLLVLDARQLPERTHKLLARY